ncbi:MAG: glutamate 5-kinase [Candidatus Omnitrophota bacterium]
MKQSSKNFKRIVVKIGSSLLCPDKGKLERGLLNEITGQIQDLVKDGKEIVVVSSGAIALGMAILKLESRPKELAYLQAAAAIGQPELMDIYRESFKQRQLNCPQLLLTWEDFNDRSRYLNAKNTLLALLKLNSVPIINENDTVSTDEIKFGDNDRLSALVSILIGADLLVILSDVDGLLEKDKKTLVRLVDKITPQIHGLACPTDKKTCVGGMVTKIEAARIVVDSGIPCVIANGRRKGIIKSCVDNSSESGTLFLPKKDHLAAKKRWIAFSAKPKGKIIVDDGARLALLNKKSLLSVGIVGCEGSFNKGDIVSLRDKQNREFARGKAALSSGELDKIKGRRCEKEAAHCDNIVIL